MNLRCWRCLISCRRISDLQCVRAKEVMLECCWIGAALHWLLPQGYDDDHWQKCRHLMLSSGDATRFRRPGNRKAVPNVPTLQILDSSSLWGKTSQYSWTLRSLVIYIYGCALHVPGPPPPHPHGMVPPVPTVLAATVVVLVLVLPSTSTT